MTELIGQQATGALMFAFVYQWLKNAKWLGLVNENTANWVHRTISVIVAVGTAAGLHMTFDHSTGDFTFTGNIHTLIHYGMAIVEQIVLQEGAYQTTIKPQERLKDLIDLLRQQHALNLPEGK